MAQCPVQRWKISSSVPLCTVCTLRLVDSCHRPTIARQPLHQENWTVSWSKVVNDAAQPASTFGNALHVTTFPSLFAITPQTLSPSLSTSKVKYTGLSKKQNTSTLSANIVGPLGLSDMGYREARPRHGTRESTHHQEVDNNLDILNNHGRGYLASLQPKVCCLIVFVFEAFTYFYKDPTSYCILSILHERAIAVANFSYLWADHRNGVLGRTGGESVGDDDGHGPLNGSGVTEVRQHHLPPQ